MVLLSSSCANVPSNGKQTSERAAQATDVISSSGNIARAVFRATAVAAVRQPVTTFKLGLVTLWQRPREIIVGNLPFDWPSQAALPDVPGTWQFEKLLDRKHFPAAESGSLKWLVDGPGFFPEVDRQLASATRSIDAQVFIFDNDDIGVRYADALKNRAAQVRVRVLFDDFGSTFSWTASPATLGEPGFVPPSDMEDYLTNHSKVKVRRTLNPWLACDHTKLFVFDRRTAILGGMNIGREYYSEWHDLMVRVEGPVVGSLAREFNRAWRKAGPSGDFALFRKPRIFRRHKPVTEGIPLRILRTDPAESRYDILDATLLAIRGARKRIWIETPYFGHDDIVSACAAAAGRGVDVRVILPASGDSPIMDAGNLATANTLIRAGAKVFRYPKMTHMKVMICDGWACAGSANLDTLSMRINRELDLAFSQPAAVRELEKVVFTPDFRRSRRVELAETESAAAGIAETLVDQL
ncbi:MAG: phosphatidylserine/phosphatidylglycerophosphate/cardiolipin synthase family protein [Luteolibacter sp.]|uniref:phospholipase D-like domain-containing protein n=1 Tax=Luteolibacter sp. TaxID=1962973 RepID=UPI003267C459